MTKWKHFDVKGITAPVTQIKNVVNGIDKIISVIDTFNQITNNIISVLNSLKLPIIHDPKQALINSLINMLETIVKDFANTGGYILPIFPQDNKGVLLNSFTGLEGGSVKFKNKIVESFSDIYDSHRPQYDDRAMVGGIVLAVDSGNMPSLISSLSSFTKIFNFPEIPPPVADTIGLNSRSFKNEVLLQWSKGFGIEPTNFIIEAKALGEEKFEIRGIINIETWNKEEQAKTRAQLNEDRITEGIGSYIPHGIYRFIDKPEKHTMYTYQISSEYNGKVMGNPATIQAAPQLYEIEKLLSENTCAYVGCQSKNVNVTNASKTTTVNGVTTVSGASSTISRAEQELTFSCEADYTTRLNFNQTTCIKGTTLCEKLLNGNCAFNNGKECTSTGETKEKTIVLNKQGKQQKFPNTHFYNSTRCQKGTTSRYCDGYKKEIQKNSSPPDWTQYTIKSLFPPLVDVLDKTVGMLEGFKGNTAKEDDVQLIFSNTLLSTTDVLKDKLKEIRNLINTINNLFNVSLPNAYILSIPPQRGGVKYFINELNSALDGPNSNEKGYTIGLVMLVGGLDVADINTKWKAINSIF